MAVNHLKLSWFSLPVSELEQPTFTYFSVLSLVHVSGEVRLLGVSAGHRVCPWFAE